MTNQSSAAQILQQVMQENKRKRGLAKLEAESIPGKQRFDIAELRKYWWPPQAAQLSAADLAIEMQEIEDQYYMTGAQYLTMEAFGKHLLEMERYR